jgi:hypothetical protein
MELWQKLAIENGLPGVHFSAMISNTTTIRRRGDGSLERVVPNLQSSQRVYQDILSLGFDSITSYGKSRGEMLALGKYRRIITRFLHNHLPFLPVMSYNYQKTVANFFSPEDSWENVFPTVIPQWDRSPRVGSMDGIYKNATPDNFKKHLANAISIVSNKQPEHRLIFLKSWNEWAEGNYVEPDEKYGHQYLEAIRATLS